jgi:hypothetical protein
MNLVRIFPHYISRTLWKRCRIIAEINGYSRSLGDEINNFTLPACLLNTDTSSIDGSMQCVNRMFQKNRTLISTLNLGKLCRLSSHALSLSLSLPCSHTCMHVIAHLNEKTDDRRNIQMGNFKRARGKFKYPYYMHAHMERHTYLRKIPFGESPQMYTVMHHFSPSVLSSQAINCRGFMRLWTSANVRVKIFLIFSPKLPSNFY